MNVEKVVKELKTLHPGKNIVLNTPEHTTEIICELDPVSQKEAIAVIDYSAKHYHEFFTEIYEVLKGTLIIYMENHEVKLEKGDRFEMKPGVVHYAKGDETWIKVYSDPGWSKKDHILV